MKRIVPSVLPVRPELEVIALKPGDLVVGGGPAPDGGELVFVTSDAQLLRFAAASVRPQGHPAGGMAGINLSPSSTVIHFSPVDADAVAVTISAADGVLPGTDAGRVKVSRFESSPPRAGATGGVRAHSFLKGEDRLTLAWVGRTPPLAVAPDGAPRALADATAKRDASGQPHRRRHRLGRPPARLTASPDAAVPHACSISRARVRAPPRLLIRRPTTSRSARPLSSLRESAACARVCWRARSPDGLRMVSYDPAPVFAFVAQCRSDSAGRDRGVPRFRY